MNALQILREGRERKGWTQELVSRNLKITRNWVSHLENGHVSPGLKMLKALLALYEIDLPEERVLEMYRTLRTGKHPVLDPVARKLVTAYERKDKTACLRIIPSLRDQRDRALYETLWYTGQRLDAIRLLQRSDVDLAGGRLHVRTKGGVEAQVVLPDPARERLAVWLSLCQWSPCVFPSLRTGRPISPYAVSHRLPVLALAAGISKRVWVHGLRHSAITHWVNSGVDVALAQKQALHRNIATTMAYAQVADAAVKRALDAVYAGR